MECFVCMYKSNTTKLNRRTQKLIKIAVEQNK